MRKQTKIAAVASAAALLAIGASMTSFAATGWVEEDGTWYFYDKDGNKVEDDWKKSGNNWYWLDGEEGGAMATDKLIEDGENTYYVDGNGVMVTNTWVKVVNEEQDDEDDPAEYHYYYMQGNGKAYKSDKFSKKTIDGKKFAFDTDGKMLYGWVDKDTNARVTGDEGWKTATNYFGSWEDGSMKTNWQFINVYDAWDSSDDDGDYWFYFGSNGVKRVGTSDADDTIRINGKRYAFTENGEMYYKWLEENTPSGVATADAWKYFSSPEDGARMTKGWFKVVPKNDLDNEMSSDVNDEAQWYYADGSGSLYNQSVKKIGGKYYAFDEYGAMLSGLVHMDVNEVDGIINEIYAKQDSNREAIPELDSDYLDALKNGDAEKVALEGSIYYFGNPDSLDTDGAMKTGSLTLNIDGSSYSFNFSASGGVGSRGAGRNGLSKKVYYRYGMKMAASGDDKYRAAEIDADDIASLLTTTQVKALVPRESVVYNAGKSNQTTIKYYDLSKLGDDDKVKLLGTNGQLKKNAKGVKDGEDWYFFSDGAGNVTYYADDKNVVKAIEQNTTK